MRKFPAIGVSALAKSTCAAAALESRGFEVSLIDTSDFAELTTAALERLDVLIVDIATPTLPDTVWSWVSVGGGMVCVGQPSAAIAADLSARTGRTWTPGPYELVALTSPVSDTIPAYDLVAGVGQIKASSAHWSATSDAGLDEQIVLSSSPAAPSVLVSQVDAGRIALIADAGLVADFALADSSARELWINTVGAAAGVSTSVKDLEPEAEIVSHPAWLELKSAVEAFRPLQAKDGSLIDGTDKRKPRTLIKRIVAAIGELAPLFPADESYLTQLQADLTTWSKDGLGIPDFLDSLVAFRPDLSRVDRVEHLVLFPMYTQNGNPNRQLEAVLLRVVWPDFVAELEKTYSNPQFVPVEFLDFTAGYDTASAVLFPETVAVREVPKFTWGAIFCDREAARFRRIIGSAVETMRLPLPPEAARLLSNQELAQETFVMWDLIHDRTHSRGDLPFDPFMIKQRMPFWLYALEELRCDLTAYRAAVELEQQGVAHARLVQYAVFFDRTFRFPITGGRQRNYDGLGGQLVFAYLHRAGVVNWTDNRLTVDWVRLPEAMIGLLAKIEDLYWRSIDRPKISHWLASYELVTEYVEPHPASTWAQGRAVLPLEGELKEMTNLVMPDEFPLSMFFEALQKRLGDVVASTQGITGRTSIGS